jgi:ferredoxin-nitrite reductase
MNKIEEYKREKDGLDVLEDVPRFAREGWESINDGDRERLKWLGVFFRRQTPGHFMMRVRVPNGKSTSAQFRAIAEIGRDFGKGFVDLTTRQQVQLRWFAIDQVQPIWDRLEEVGLVSLQTGMDNIRNVVGCPVAGLTANELFDASPVVQQYTDIFLRNKAYTNLPRKFNVTITGCRENCTHGRTQDISLTPAVQILNGEEIKGFNVAVGGKQGSGGYRPASPLNIFVPPEEAAELCSHITLIFSDHGSREARNKARLSFLIDHWGVAKFRQELEKRVSHPLPPGGVEVSQDCQTDHVGVFPQKQAGLNYVGIVVPVGRIDTEQLLDVARLADVYGNGEIRLTTQQNLIISNVPDAKLSALRAEPLLAELRCDPSEAMRGTVSCTGIDYCHFALIDTKELAVKTARYLEERLGQTEPISIHWSGCPNACGNHAVADIGLLGRKARVNGQIIDAVDIFLGDRLASRAAASGECLENIPCEELPRVLERLISAPAALTV